jgi:hypothetical protein
LRTFGADESAHAFCELGADEVLRAHHNGNTAGSLEKRLIGRHQPGCLMATAESRCHHHHLIIIIIIVLWLPKTPSELKMQGFRSFVRSWCYHDELSFRRLFLTGRLHFSNPCRTAGGDPRALSPTHRSPKERASSFAPPALRPVLMVLLSRCWPGWRRSLHIIRPDTGSLGTAERSRGTGRGNHGGVREDRTWPQKFAT